MRNDGREFTGRWTAAAASHTFLVPVDTSHGRIRAYRLVPHGQHRDRRSVGYAPDREKLAAELAAIAAEVRDARRQLSHADRIGQSQRSLIAIDLSGVESFNTAHDPAPFLRFQHQLADIATISFVGADAGIQSSLRASGILPFCISDSSLADWLARRTEKQVGG